MRGLFSKPGTVKKPDDPNAPKKKVLERAPGSKPDSSKVDSLSKKVEGLEVADNAEPTVKLKYNHYNKEFKIHDGKLHWPTVDEVYCISYVFEGNFKRQVFDKDRNELDKQGDGWVGLVRDGEYTLEITADPTVEKQTGPIKIASQEGSGGISRKTVGDPNEDSSSCSCIEGNPCISAYNCKDWANRFQVAERVMKEKTMKA